LTSRYWIIRARAMIRSFSFFITSSLIYFAL
jgi:hypothetical protein